MLLRALRPEDAARVQAFVRGLSSRSRLERFFAPVAELSPGQLERITSGAGASLAAFDGSGAIVALAEYVRVGAGEAKFAIVIADAWQGQGLGARLLARRLGFGLHADEDPDLVRMELALA